MFWSVFVVCFGNLVVWLFSVNFEDKILGCKVRKLDIFGEGWVE